MTDARLDRFPVYVAAVKAQRAVSPTIWLVAGDPFADRTLAVLSDGAAPMVLFNEAGVDAVVLTPSWLGFGLSRVGQIVSSARFYALSASVLDSLGQPLGQPFMVRRSGSALLAVTGVAIDSTNVLTHLNGTSYVTPGFAIAKTTALMRGRADLAAVMVEPRTSGSHWGADFMVNVAGHDRFAMTVSDDTARLNCYDVSADAGRFTARTVDVTGLRSDSATVRLLESLAAAADSTAARPMSSPHSVWTNDNLSHALVGGMLTAKLADGFLCDSLFQSDFQEPKDVQALVSLLRDPGRLAVLTVSGDVLSGLPDYLVLRSGLVRSKLSRSSSYRIATTVDYLQRHPAMAKTGFELSARPFWTICLDILQSGQVK
ncbi:MAG TPA: hypothetical protein VMH22_12820 [bacterium]|nr:hypothetical protein [bacterium]